MKKVFAFLSTIVLTLACVGVALAPVKAAQEVEVADGKWIVNPTLEEKEIPMYVMNSIMTTFPNFYDNNAQPDPNYDGASRQFPWNGVKLFVPQLGADGSATGYSYGAYMAGLSSALGEDGLPASGTGVNLLPFPTTGNYQPTKNPSLSFLRFNATVVDGKLTGWNDQVIDVTATAEPNNNSGVAYMVFDGQGKAVRGLTAGNGKFFTSEDWTPIHCFAEDGSLIEYDANFTGCRKAQVQQTDADGKPVFDENNNPVMVISDQPDLVTYRVLWQYFPIEQKDQLKINANGYMGEGWRQDYWDYYLDEYQIAITYLPGDDGNYGGLSEVEAVKHLTSIGTTVYTDNATTVAANGQFSAIVNKVLTNAVAPVDTATTTEYKAAVTAYNKVVTEYNKAVPEGQTAKTALKPLELTAGTKRETYEKYQIPAKGFFYSFGFLDRGKAPLQALYNQMYVQGMKYGRSENYSAKLKTYDYEGGNVTSKLYADGQNSFFPLEGKKNPNGNEVIEVVRGVSFKPIWNVNYASLAKYWATKDDIFSYTSNPDNIKMYITVNGAMVVDADWPYLDDSQKKEMAEAFLTDYYNYHVSIGATSDPDAMTFIHGAGLTDGFAGSWGGTGWNFFNGASADGQTGKGFLFDPVYRAKWQMFISFMANLMNGRGYQPGEVGYKSENFFASATTAIARIKAYLTNATYYNPAVVTTIPKTFTKDTYIIDTTNAPRDKHYFVTYKIENTATNNKATFNLDYFVVDVKTPVLTINPLAFYMTQGDKLDLSKLATAQNGYGNVASFYGTDISHKIIYEIETNGVQFNYKSIPAGVFKVTMSVYNDGNLTPVMKEAYLRVTDTQKPVVDYQALVRVAQNHPFYFTDAIISAKDNLDGDLFTNPSPSYTPFVENTDPIDTSKPGRYTVEFDVYDRAGNKVSGTYDVIVTADNSKSITDKLAELQDGMDTLLDNGNTQQGCAAPAAPATVAFVSAIGLLASTAFVVLRRKH